MSIKKLTALVMAGVICASVFTGCGVNPGETVATLGEQTITFDVANFLCKYQKATMDDMYVSYAEYYGVESLWDQDVSGNGSTMEADFKADVMKMLHELYTLKAHMADYNVEVTEEEEAAIEEAVKAFMKGNSEEAIKEFGATEEVVTEVLTLYTIQAKMRKAIIVDVDRVVSDEDANMRGYSVIEISLEGETDETGAQVTYTDEQVAEIKANATKMTEALQSTPMETVAEEYGYEVSEGAYGKDGETLDGVALAEELVTALDALQVAQVSGMIETDTTLYFARIDEETDTEATEEHREAIITERENARYDEVLKKWQTDDGWEVKENVVAKIDFHNLFTQTSESTEETEATEATETESVQTTESN